jgi:hypothetical protein
MPAKGGVVVRVPTRHWLIISGVLLVFGLAAVFWSPPVLIRAIGIAMLVSSPLYVWIALVTNLIIRPDGVCLRTVRRSLDVARGEGSVRTSVAPIGFLGSGLLITVTRHRDHRRASMILTGYRRRDRDQVVASLHAALASAPD